jgi:hypothetical protein
VPDAEHEVRRVPTYEGYIPLRIAITTREECRDYLFPDACKDRFQSHEARRGGEEHRVGLKDI